MKTERHHHEPQSDEAPDVLGDAWLAIEPYSKLILGLLIAGLAVFVLVRVTLTRRAETEAASWHELAMAIAQRDPESLQKIADNYPKSEAAAWALLKAADEHIILAMEAEQINRVESRKSFEKARDNYDAAYQQGQRDMLRQRALLGLAQAHQGLNELKGAAEAYQTIIESWAGTSVADLAKERLQLVQLPSTRRFYDWYLEQKPVVPAPPSGDAAAPKTSVYDDLPTVPSLSLPESGLQRPGTDSTFGPVVPPSTANPTGTDATGTDATGTDATGTDATGTDGYVPTTPEPTDSGASAPDATSPATSPETAPAAPETPAVEPAVPNESSAPADAGGTTPPTSDSSNGPPSQPN